MWLYKPSLSILTYKHGYIFSIEMVCQRKKAEMNKGKSQRSIHVGYCACVKKKLYII